MLQMLFTYSISVKGVSNNCDNEGFFSSRNVPRHQRNVIADQTKHSMTIENSTGVSKSLNFTIWLSHSDVKYVLKLITFHWKTTELQSLFTRVEAEADDLES